MKQCIVKWQNRGISFGLNRGGNSLHEYKNNNHDSCQCNECIPGVFHVLGEDFDKAIL